MAGGGFGKTTLLAQWGGRGGCAWYTIEREDAVLGVFAAGLLAALRPGVADLPLEIIRASGRAGAPGAEDRSRAEALATHLSVALDELLADDLVLVLDDLQEIDPRSPSMRLVEGLCRHAPSRLHLVLSSRTEIPFGIARLRGRGEVLDIDASRLAFSTEEIHELCRDVLHENEGDLAAALEEMTGGWPAGVRLALEALRGAGPTRSEEVLTALKQPGGTLFGYLAEELFAREEPEVREVLRRVAAFDRCSTPLCESLGLGHAPAVLAGLARRGLFVQPQTGPGDWFVLHGLIRDFALKSWPLPEDEIRALHVRAAAWFEKHGLLAEALRSLAAASDPQGIARLLAARGEELLSRGDIDAVLDLGAALPLELRSTGLEELLGEAYTVRGDADRAQECFRRATDGSDDLPPRLAWKIGLLHHERGEHDRALQLYGRGRLDGSGLADQAVLLSAMATTHLLTGDPGHCHDLCRRALCLAEECGEDRALAAAHATLMLAASNQDPHGEAEHYRKALGAAQRGGDVLLEIRLRTNHASQLDNEGAYGQAIEELDAAILLAELAGYTERLALALNNRGWTHFHIGRLQEAIGDLERSKTLYRGVGSVRAQWPLINLGSVYLERGDLALARTVLEEGLALAESSNDSQGRIGARANLARILATEEPEEATRLAEEATGIALTWGALVDALLAAGWVALAQGDRERAAGLGDEAHAAALARRNRPGLAEALELQALSAPEPAGEAIRLGEAISIWRELGNPLGEARAELALARLTSTPNRALMERSKRALREIGVRSYAASGAAGPLAALPGDEGVLVEIRTLGGFRVLRHGEPVTISEWRSKKARDLVKILISRRGRAVPREALMETLWPEESPEPLPKRLSVALAAVRGILDRERQFTTDRFVAGDDCAVWLDLSHVSVDVEEFLTEAAAGLALHRRGRTHEGREVLAAAEATYAGDFLEEDPYEDWAIALREEARAAYIAVARALADLAGEAGDHDAAISYRLRVLERDAYDEGAHLGLVRELSRAGRYGEARRLYRVYTERMEELGVEPAPLPGS
ncbi:MAG: BTAD domain-containing putative transcriptional regulator [Gemmatimonadota bacterium]